MTESSDTPDVPRGLRRVLLLVSGWLALGLGALGVVLPLLPATPFVLLAAACFAGSSPRMHRRLRESRLFGPMVEAGPGGRYLPTRTKVGVIGFTLVSIAATAVFFVGSWIARGILAGVALVITVLICRIPSAPRPGGEPPA